MKKRSLTMVALAVSAALCLAACGGSSAGSGSAGSGNAGTENAGGSGSSDSANAGGSGSAASYGASSKKSGAPADKFVYHTSAEVAGFMESYTGTKELNWGEPKWEMNGDEIEVSGSLTPDKSAFTSVSATYRVKSKGNEKTPEELLGPFYEDLCAKTGTTFPEAEELIRSLSGLEERQRFENGPLKLEVSKSSNSYEVRMYRTDASTDCIPYTPADAAAFMKNKGGESVDISRKVTNVTPIKLSTDEEMTYKWSATLDADERIRHISAQYYGEDPAEGKAFFTALTEFFLTGDVLKQGQALIDGHYDTIEVKANEKAEMDKPYSMQLQRRSDYYSVSISVRAENVPSDAPAFPSAEELAMLQKDPIARLGIDMTAELPETGICELEGMKIMLERSYYDTSPDLVIGFRGEGIPENGFAEIYVDKINGQEIVPTGTYASHNGVYLDAKGPEDEAYFRLYELKELLPDFTGLESVTVSGYVRLDQSAYNSPEKAFDGITIEAVK